MDVAVFIILFISICNADRFIYTNDGINSDGKYCDFYGNLNNDTWAITPYKYTLDTGTDTYMGSCQPYEGYFPSHNNPSRNISFNYTQLIISDDWACVYFYQDSECKKAFWQDCLNNQSSGKTNVTRIYENIKYPFTRKCFCWWANVKPCYT